MCISVMLFIEDLGEAMDMDLEDGEIDTVGGLILNLLEAPAEKGDTVGYRGLEFKVTRTENGGVERCTVTRITTLMREEVLEEEE